MTDQELRKLMDAGVDRNEIEYIISHDEIGSENQDILIRALASGVHDLYESVLQEMLWSGIVWDESKDEHKVLPPEEEELLNTALEYVMDLVEPPSQITPQKQYLNLTYVMRHLFYNENDILSVISPTQGNDIKFRTDAGELWNVYYDTTSLLTVDKRLDPFDFAVLDVIYTLHKNEIDFFSTRWIDMLLSGSSKRSTTKNSLDRIDRSIEKLRYLNIQITIDGIDRAHGKLLSIQRFGNTEGSYYFLNELNDLYEYAAELKQFANVPATYFDTTSLSKEYKFSDTETAIYIKRRIIARVMGILRQSLERHHARTHWNRISLIHAKEKKYYDPKGRQKTISAAADEYPPTKKRGLFAELGLMPDVDGLSPAEQKEIMSKWRKTKADYMRIIRGTLQHLKDIYVILDYIEVRANESKSLREPVIAYDIVCFTKTEVSALNGMRDELKPAYVKKLLNNRLNPTLK